MQYRTDIGHRAIAPRKPMTTIDRDRHRGAARLVHADCRSASSQGSKRSTASAFRRDDWTRPEGGGGISRMIEDGRVLERGGVLFSHVTGERLPPSATAHRPELAGRAWEAMGVSLVLHPRNPYAPTVHLNVRFFVARKAERRARSGGSAAAWT